MKSMTLAGLVLVGLIPVAADAAPASIKFAFPAPPRSLVNKWSFAPWVKEVNAASGGTLAIKIIAGPTLGNFRNIYPRTIKGVTDISFGVHGPMGKQFRKTSVGLLPYESNNTLEAAAALWSVYEQGLIADEYKGVKVLGLFNFPHSALHSKGTNIKSAKDLKGMKIAVNAPMNARIVVALGGTPVTMTPPQVYQSASRGLVNGFLIAWTAVGPFKLAEVSKYHLDVDSFGGGTAFVVMNPKTFAGLPAQARKAIDDRSGMIFSRRLGKSNIKIGGFFRGLTTKKKGHVFNRLSASETASWKKKLAPLTADWLKRVPNGANILKAYRATVLKVRAEK